MSEYEKMCREFVEYMGGDINSDEYKIYLLDPFPSHIFKEMKSQLKETQEKLKIAVDFLEMINGKNDHHWILGKLESTPNKEYIGWDEIMLSSEALKKIGKL